MGIHKGLQPFQGTRVYLLGVFAIYRNEAPSLLYEQVHLLPLGGSPVLQGRNPSGRKGVFHHLHNHVCFPQGADRRMSRNGFPVFETHEEGGEPRVAQIQLGRLHQALPYVCIIRIEKKNLLSYPQLLILP